MIFDNQGVQTLKGNVVVVEDDDLMLSVLVEILEDMGGTCSGYVTADDALMGLLTRTSPVALVVTDYTLPGQLDGREFLMMVKARWPAIPILLTSGYGSEVIGDLPDGVAFLQKPWSVAQMTAAVNVLL